MSRVLIARGGPPLLWVCCLALTACDGPHEKAGRSADQAAAQSLGQNQTGEGPNERIGKSQDRVERADGRARDAAADALERQGDKLREQADLDADRLDERAKALRSPTK